MPMTPMTPITSDDLRRLLHDEAFTETPPGNPERMGQIELRIARRRRRLRGQVAVVAAAIVAVAAGSTVVAGRGDSGDGAPASSPAATGGPLRAMTLPPATPVEQLWPQAVTKLPAKLPNGRDYHIEAFVDDHTLLVTTSSGFEKTDAAWLYDTATKQVRLVTHVTTPPGATTFASDFAVGDGHVAWWTGRKEKGETIAEVWSAPLPPGGGQSRKVATMAAGRDQDGGLERLVIADRKVIWSLATFSPGAEGGIFTAPLTGGEPVKIFGSDGYHIMEWPWVGTPGDRGNSRNLVAFKDLRDAHTGERRLATVGPGRWSCGLSWCEGYTARGMTLMRRDGSGGRLLRGEEGSPFNDIVLDRFVLLPHSKTIQLYDLRSGKVADLGPPKVARSFRPVRPGDRLYSVERTDGYLVVNLAAIR